MWWIAKDFGSQVKKKKIQIDCIFSYCLTTVKQLRNLLWMKHEHSFFHSQPHSAQSAALQLTTDWCQWENSQTEDKQYIMGFWFFKLLIRTRASNYTHSCLFSSWRQRKQNLLGVVRITTLFLTQNEYGSSGYKKKKKKQGPGHVRTKKNKRLFFCLFSIFCCKWARLRLTNSWPYAERELIPRNQRSPIHDLADI